MELRRGSFYFEFWGASIMGWLNRVVMLDRLGALTLGEWLEKYRELEKQNRSANPLGRRRRS